MGPAGLQLTHGGVAERLMAAVLKTVVAFHVTVGSNPTPSVMQNLPRKP